MSVHIVVVNGRPCSGKTTFEKLCMEELTYADIYSTIDFVKKIATECGWDGEKTDRNRKFLSDLKDLLTDWADVPYESVLKKKASIEQELKSYYLDDIDYILFVDSREPEEIDRFEKLLDAVSVVVRRPEVESEPTSNHADENVLRHIYNYTIWNDGTIEDLKNKVISFIIDLENDKGFKLERRTENEG